MFYLLKTSDVLEVLVPILFHVSASRNDPGMRNEVFLELFVMLKPLGRQINKYVMFLMNIIYSSCWFDTYGCFHYSIVKR